MSNWTNFNRLDDIYNNIAIKIVNNDKIAKLLYYPDADALDKPNLTQDQKLGLIRQTDRDKCRIFNIAPTYFVTEGQRAEIRIYEASISSIDPYKGRVRYSFDIVCHQELWVLSNGQRRVMQIIIEILTELNGEDVGGIGKMAFFNNRHQDMLKYKFYNDVMTGYQLFGFVLTGGASNDEC